MATKATKAGKSTLEMAELRGGEVLNSSIFYINAFLPGWDYIYLWQGT